MGFLRAQSSLRRVAPRTRAAPARPAGERGSCSTRAESSRAVMGSR